MNLERLTKPIPVTDTTPLAELMDRLLIDRRDAAAEIKRLREALRDIACECEDHCDDSPYGHGAITPNCCRNFARTALGEKE